MRVVPPVANDELANGESSDNDDVILVDDDGQEEVLKMGSPKSR